MAGTGVGQRGRDRSGIAAVGQPGPRDERAAMRIGGVVGNGPAMSPTARTRRVCIIGGGFAQRYARAFAAEHETEVVAVCTRTADGAARMSAATGARPYTDAQRMLRNEAADIVVIATPNDLHHPLAMAALGAGADVMCEKPLALNVAQATEMAAFAAQLGRRTSTGFTWRFLPGCVAMKSLIASGALGQPYHVEMRYFTRGFGTVHGPMRWQYDRSRAGSGALANLGTHAIDLLHWWFGDVRRVAAVTRTVIADRANATGETAAVSVDDVCTATYELTDGTPAALSAGWVAHIGRVGLDVEVHGSAASAWLRYASNEEDTRMGRLSYCDESMAAPEPRTVGDAAGDWTDIGQACISRLVACFLQTPDAQSPHTPDFADGLRAQCVVDATLAASSERRWVDVEYAPADAGERDRRVAKTAEAAR